MRGVTFAIMLSAWLVASAGTTVYTWVDAQGVTHYSDQPHAGATKLKVQDAPTFAAPPVASVSESQAQKPSEHNQCSIESPTDQQMFMNAYSVSGRVHLPQVNPGDRLIVMLDGTVLPGAADLGGHFTIAQVDRGTHTLAAQLLGPTGQVICEAPSVTFYVHQPNLNSPTNQQPVAPPPRPRG